MPLPYPFTHGNNPTLFVKEAGWTPGPFWTAAENSALLGLDPRTVQPVASHCTHYVTAAHKFKVVVTYTRKYFLLKKESALWNYLILSSNL
jgi:hypothetical protein